MECLRTMEAKSKESKNRLPSIVEAGVLAVATIVDNPTTTTTDNPTTTTTDNATTTTTTTTENSTTGSLDKIQNMLMLTQLEGHANDQHNREDKNLWEDICDKDIYKELLTRISKVYKTECKYSLPELVMEKLELKSDVDLNINDFDNLLETFSRIMELRLPDSTKQYLFYYSLQCIEPVWNKTVPANLEVGIKKYLKNNRQDINSIEEAHASSTSYPKNILAKYQEWRRDWSWWSMASEWRRRKA